MKATRYIVLLALVLALVGIAYVRALFSHQDRPETVSPEVFESLPPDLLDDYLEKDEVARRLDSLQNFYADSLEKAFAGWESAKNEKAEAVADSLRRDVENLQNKLKTAQADVTRAEQSKTQQFEKLVLAFYHGEIAQLPSDLSKYERDVSVKEIKHKAQKYFGITSQKLNTILKKHK